MVSPDQSQALFPVSQLAMPDHTLPGALRFPGWHHRPVTGFVLLTIRIFSWSVKAGIPCAGCPAG
ncbi:hypothetical protein ECZU28_36930 [Escherichia coli]|nr:hypothetical protein ECZU28_36930 [Escherichia coli]